MKQSAKQSIADLSFVAKRDGKSLPRARKDQSRCCFWNVHASGDHFVDCSTGQKLALEYLEFEAADPSGPGHLQYVVGDMPRPLTGVEIGFLIMVSYAAGAGVHKARRIAAYWQSKSDELMTS